MSSAQKTPELMFSLRNTANTGGALSGENHCRVVCPDDSVAGGILDFFVTWSVWG